MKGVPAGTSKLTFPVDGFTLLGTDASKFTITAKPGANTTVDPGQSVTVSLTFTASTVDDIRTATLQIKSNDPNNGTITIPLRGLGKLLFAS